METCLVKNNVLNTQQYIDKALNLGLKHENNNRPNDAIAVYEAILGKHPKLEEPVLRISSLFLKYKEFENAIKSLSYLISITERKYDAYYNLAVALERLERHDEAASAYLESVKDKGDFGPAYYGASNLMLRLGRLSELENILIQNLKRFPKLGDIHWAQGKFDIHNGDIIKAESSFEKAYSFGISEPTYYLFLSEYANLKGKLKHYNDAMKMHELAQNLLAKKPESIAVNTQFSDMVTTESARWFTADIVKNWQKKTFTGKSDPVFVVGFPRSGTTLMEQILYAHPNLTVTSESQVLVNNIKKIDSILNRHVSYPKGYNSIQKREIKSWREAYYKGIEQSVVNLNPTLRIVDKNPMSIRHLGSINRFFPASPILVMIRDPRDVCLSCFFQSFKPNQTTIHFNTLEDTFKYYAKTMSLYLKFRENLSLNILEVNYEKMCVDFEPTVKRIINHIGEEWQDSLLDFYKPEHKRYISTPSFDGVTQPVYNNAVGKWQHYEEFVAPLEYIIKPYLEAFAYR